VEVKLFFREPVTVVFTFLLPLVFLFVLAEVFTRARSDGLYGGAKPIDFYSPAYIGLVMAAVGVISVPSHIARYRETGVLRRFHASSLPWITIAASQVLISVAIIAVSSAVLLVAVSISYDVSAPASLLGVIGAGLISALAFSVLGVLMGVLLPSARSAQLAGLILFFMMLLLSGPGPPPELLGDGLKTAAKALPLTHVVDFLQDPWLGEDWNGKSCLIVVGMLLVSLVLLAATARRWK